jgi:hypothetical protein
MPVPRIRRLRRHRSRKGAQMLVALDRAAAEARPRPAQRTRVSLAK